MIQAASTKFRPWGGEKAGEGACHVFHEVEEANLPLRAGQCALSNGRAASIGSPYFLFNPFSRAVNFGSAPWSLPW